MYKIVQAFYSANRKNTLWEEWNEFVRYETKELAEKALPAIMEESEKQGNYRPLRIVKTRNKKLVIT